MDIPNSSKKLLNIKTDDIMYTFNSFGLCLMQCANNPISRRNFYKFKCTKQRNALFFFCEKKKKGDENETQNTKKKSLHKNLSRVINAIHGSDYGHRQKHCEEFIIRINSQFGLF